MFRRLVADSTFGILWKLVGSGLVMFCLIAGGPSVHGQVEVSKRLGFLQNYPCLGCHENITPVAETGDEVDATKSAANLMASKPMPTVHKNIKWDHMKQPGIDCWLCHDKDSPNNLKTLGGKSVTFDQSYKVCTQCHGERGRDWSLGIHGKDVGKWNGAKTRYSCVDCHNPHSPKYKATDIFPAPKFPKFGIRKTEGHH